MINNFLYFLYVISWLEWAIPENMGWGYTVFEKKKPEFFDLSLCANKLSPTDNSAKLCDTTWKYPGQKQRPMEIPHEFLLSNQGTANQVLYFLNLNYLNSMIKSILKIVSCHQSSTTGSLFALMFITMRQLHLLLVNYLNLSALTCMEKIQLQ